MVNSLLFSPLLRRGNTAPNDLVKYKFSGRVVHFVGTAEWPLANKTEKDVVICQLLLLLLILNLILAMMVYERMILMLNFYVQNLGLTIKIYISNEIKNICKKQNFSG